MEFEATEIQEFNIYLKVAKVLLHDLDNLTDQTKAAQWVQTLGPGLPTRKNQTRLMLSYVKLLVCALLRKKLVEPFTNSPGPYLDESYGNLKLTDMWLMVSKSAWLARSGAGEPSPCHVEVSGDRQQYACVQRVTDGAQCYFAISAAQKLERWNNTSRTHLPKVYKTDKKQMDLPPLPDLKPLPDTTLLEQKLTKNDIQKAKDVLKRIKDRDATISEQDVLPPSEAGDIPATPPRRYSLPWDKIEAGIPPTMSPSDPEYVDMSRTKYPAGYVKDFPTRGGAMDWGSRRKYVQEPFSPEKPSADERQLLENITEASVLEPTLGELPDLTHISQEEPSFYDSFRDNLDDPQRRTVSFRDAKLNVPFDSMQNEMPEYRRPLSRISENSETSMRRESIGKLLESPYTPKFPDTPSLSHTQRSPDTPGMFGSASFVPSTPRSIRTPGSLPYTPGSLPFTPGSLPSTPGSYYPDSPGMLPYTPRKKQDESMDRRMMRSQMDSTQSSQDDSRNFYKKLGYSSIGAYLDGILPETVPVVKESPAAEVPDDEAWERRLGEIDQDGDRSFRWIGGGHFDMRHTEGQTELQADFIRHLAAQEDMVQVPESPDQDRFGSWMREQRRRNYDEDTGSTNATHPRDGTRIGPSTLRSPALFKRGGDRRDRKYRPSEFGLTGEEHWTPAETYFRGSIEPILDPDERAVDRIIRFIDGSILEDEEMDFSSVLEDSVPDWERPSWPGHRFTVPPTQFPQADPRPVSPRTPSRKGIHTDFISNGPPRDMLDPVQFVEHTPERPDYLRMSTDIHLPEALIPAPQPQETSDEHFSLSRLNTSIFDNVLENERRGDPRSPFRRQELGDYENLEDETPLDIPIANASVDDSSTSDRSEIPGHLWASELYRIKSAWNNLQGNVSKPLTESNLEFQDESFPHSQYIQTSISTVGSPDRSYRQLQDESFPQSEFIETTQSIVGSPDRSYRQLQDESFPQSEFIETTQSIVGSPDRSYRQLQDESFPHSDFIQTTQSTVGSPNRSYRQLQDESFPQSEFIETTQSIVGSPDRSHRQLQDESFPQSELIETTQSMFGSPDRSYRQLQDESFPHSDFIQTTQSTVGSPNRSYRQLQDESFPQSEFIETTQSIVGSPDRSYRQLQDESFPHSDFIQTTQSTVGSPNRSYRQLQDESFPQSEFIETTQSIVGSPDRSYRQLQDESFPQSEFIETTQSIVGSPDRSHRQLQDKSFPQSEFIETTQSIVGSPDRSYRQLQDESFPQSEFIETTQTIVGSPDRSYRQLQDESFPYSQFIQTSPSARIPDIYPERFSSGTPSRQRHSQSSAAIKERVIAPQRISSAPAKFSVDRTQTDDGLIAQWDRLLQSTQLNLEDEELPSFKSITEDSLPQNEMNFNVSASFIRDIESSLVPEPPLLPEIFQPGIDDLTGISLVLDDSSTIHDTFLNSSAISATSPPQLYAHVDRSYPEASTADASMISSTSIPQFMSTFDDDSHPSGLTRKQGTPESAKRYIPPPFTLPSPRRVELKKQRRIPLPGLNGTPTRYADVGSGQRGSQYSGQRRRIPRSQIIPKRLTFNEEPSISLLQSSGVKMLEDESDLQLVDDFSFSQSVGTRSPGSRRLSISPRVHASSNLHYDLDLPDVSGEQLDDFTPPSFTWNESGLPNQSMLSMETPPMYSSYIDGSGNVSRESPPMFSSYNDDSTPGMISTETPPTFTSFEDNSSPRYSSSRPNDSRPMSTPPRRQIYGRGDTVRSQFTPQGRRAPALIHQTPESAKQYIPLPFSLPSPVRFEQPKPYRTFAPVKYSTPQNQNAAQTGPRREQRTIIPRRLQFSREKSSFSKSSSGVSALEDESQPEFAVSYDDSSYMYSNRSNNRDMRFSPLGPNMLEDESQPDFAPNYDQSTEAGIDSSQGVAGFGMQPAVGQNNRMLLTGRSNTPMLEDESAPDFSLSYDQSSVASVNRSNKNAVTNQFQRQYSGVISFADQSQNQMLEDESAPDFSSIYAHSMSSDQRGALHLPDQSSSRRLDDETMPSFAPSYNDQSTSFDRREAIFLPDHRSQLLDEETMPTFPSTYYDQSTSFDRKRRLSLPDQSSSQMLEEETMPTFPSSRFDQSSSFNTRMLDEETMPSFAPSHYDTSTSFDERRRLPLRDQSSVQMLDEEATPSFAPSFYDQSTSFDRRRRLSLPDQSSSRMLEEETMPSFPSSRYDQSTSSNNKGRLSLGDPSSVQMLDEETMPSFAPSHYDTSTSFDERRRLSLRDQSSLQMLDEETTPSFAPSFNDQSTSFDRRRRLSLPDQSSSRMLEEETMPSFAPSHYDTSTSFDERRRLSHLDQSSLQMLDEETMPSFAPSYYDQSTSFDRRRRLSLAEQSSSKMLEEESMPSFASSYNRGSQVTLADQSNVDMLEGETPPDFASSYNESYSDHPNQVSSISPRSQQSASRRRLSSQSLVQDKTTPNAATCGNRKCRKDNTGSQMLEDESQPDFNSFHSQSSSYNPSRNDAEISMNRGRGGRRRLSPTNYDHRQEPFRRGRDSQRQINYPSFTGEQINDITPPSLYMERSVTIPDESMISAESPYYFSSFDSGTPSREIINNLERRRSSSGAYPPPNQRAVSTPKIPKSFRKYVRPPLTVPSPVRFQTPGRNLLPQDNTSTPRARPTSFRRTQGRRVENNDLSLPQSLETNYRLLQDESEPNVETTFDSSGSFGYNQGTNAIPEGYGTPRRSGLRYDWPNLPDAPGEQLDDISDRILSYSTFTISEPSTPQNPSKSECTICPGNPQSGVQGTGRENYLYRDEYYVPFDETNALSPFHGIDSIEDDMSSIHTSREFSFFE